MSRIIALWVHPLRPVIREIGEREVDIGGRGWGRWMDRERVMFLSNSFCQKTCLYVCSKLSALYGQRNIFIILDAPTPENIAGPI